MNRGKILIFALLFLSMIFNTMAQTAIIYEGEWEADSYFTTFKGSWNITTVDNQHFVNLGDDFEAKKAPDLKIFLSKLSLSEIDGDNAAGTSSVLVAELKKFKGKASYSIPTDINPADYASIIVHCEKYSKLWGGSSLNTK